MSVTVCYVCHNDETVLQCIKDTRGFILFVGDQPCSIKDPRIIIIRDLEYSIEQHKRLLTFTAWYAIIKNNLFEKADYLCILEYDVEINNTFYEDLHNSFKTHPDCVSFSLLRNGISLTENVSVDIFNTFLLKKSFQMLNLRMDWYPTTNHCIRRTLLKEFVDWYFPDCLHYLNTPQLSWYHERVFSVWLVNKTSNIAVLPIVKHFQKNSHASIQSTTEYNPHRSTGGFRNRVPFRHLNTFRRLRHTPDTPPTLPLVNKHVVFGLTQISKHPSSPSVFWGLGDMLRGLLAVYQYCKQYRYEFSLGLGHHPILQFFDISGDGISYLPASTAITFIGADGGKLLTERDFETPTSCVFSNVWCKEPLLYDEKQLIKRVLTIKPEYALSLPKSYNLFHFRLNDAVYKNSVNEAEFSKWLSLIQPRYTSGDYLITNCAKFKSYVKSNIPDMKTVTDDGGSHSGFSQDYKQFLTNVYDLQLTIHASKIYTFSEYNWISGFVYWPALAYDVPIVNLKTA